MRRREVTCPCCHGYGTRGVKNGGTFELLKCEVCKGEKKATRHAADKYRATLRARASLSTGPMVEDTLR